MKRGLLSLLMVLALAPVASATMLSFQKAGGGTQVVQNTVFTVDVVGDETANSFNVGNIAITGSFSNVATGTVNPLFTMFYNGNLQNGSISNVWIDNVSGLNPSTPPSAGQVLYSFTMRAGAAGGTITIDDLNGVVYGPPFNSKLNGTIVNMGSLGLSIIVPEPTTVMLLGLGGGLLLLRRRRAA